MISKSNKSKKGFTIVELVIVIAVIAILSAVLIPTFVGLVKKAKVSADVMTVRNINNSLKMSESSTGKKPATYTEMLAIADEAGYDVNKLNPTTEGYIIVWDKDSNTLFLYDDEGNLANNQQGTPSNNLWYMVSTAAEAEEASAAGKNVYLSNEYDTSTITVKGGVEVAGKTNVHLSTNEAGTYDVCLNGGALEVTADKADVNSYGTKSEVVINAVKIGTFKENGNVSGNVVLKKGGLEVKSYAKVYSVLITADNVDNVKVSIPSASSLETVVTATSETVAAALKNNTSINVPQTKVEDTAVPEDSVNSPFAGGFGTEEVPYLITSVEDFAKVTEMYEVAYAYYKVSGLTEIDGSNWTPVQLWGSIDCNGLVVNNASQYIFKYVYGGYDAETEVCEVYVKNLTVNADVTCASAATAVAYYTGASTVTLENITVHGRIEGTMNTGSFVAYGSWSNTYTVDFTFKNCYSDADVYVLGNNAGGFIGHPFMASTSTMKFVDCTMEADLYSTGNCYLIGSYSAPTATMIFVEDGVETVVDSYTKYVAEKSHKVTYTKSTAPAKYDTFSAAQAANCEKATFMLIIGPNGNGTTVKGGYYCGTYMTEEAVIDENGNLVSTEIKNFDITSNGNATTETGLSSDGTTYNIVSDSYNNEIGGASVRLVQYDIKGKVISVTEWTLYKNNARV